MKNVLMVQRQSVSVLEIIKHNYCLKCEYAQHIALSKDDDAAEDNKAHFSSPLKEA